VFESASDFGDRGTKVSAPVLLTLGVRLSIS